VSRPFDLIIFDCDGVVVDSEPLSNRVFREFLSELGLELSEPEVYARFLGRSLADSLVHVQELIGRPIAPSSLAHYKANRDKTMREEVVAVDGVAALTRARAHGVSIYLLDPDVLLPWLGGVELAAALRAERPGLRVLFVSGYERDEKLPIPEPGIASLRKPFTPDELGQAVAELLGGEGSG
jgi:beta-phosphoglucomutase-like phosphatase (HAD superfamily)